MISPYPQIAGPAKPGRLPSKDTLDWWKTALELLLLVLALPWLARELMRHPGKVSERAARKHLA